MGGTLTNISAKEIEMLERLAPVVRDSPRVSPDDKATFERMRTKFTHVGWRERVGE